MEGWFWYEAGWPNCGSQLKLTSILTTSVVLLLADNWLKSNGSSERISVLSGDFNVSGRFSCFRGFQGVLTRIGDFSFGIYFVHISVIRFLQSFSRYEALPFGLNTALVAAISIVAVVLLSCLLGPRISRLLGLQ